MSWLAGRAKVRDAGIENKSIPFDINTNLMIFTGFVCLLLNDTYTYRYVLLTHITL